MSLAICKNQLICLINDGSTSVWSIEEIDNFQLGHPCVEQRVDYFKDDWGFRWKLLEEMSTDINIKCLVIFHFKQSKVWFLCANAMKFLSYYVT